MPFLKPFLKEIPRSKRLEKASQRNGLRHTIYEPNGCKYIGEWKDDKKSGKRINQNNKTAVPYSYYASKIYVPT